MYRAIKYLLIFSMICLVGCSTTERNPNMYRTNYSTDRMSSVQTRGIGSEDNLIGTNVGPQEGILGIRSFYFKFDSSVLSSKDMEIIRAHAEYLLAHPSARVVIEGNCDIRGSREYNIGLGQRRADAVASVLNVVGVPDRQVRTLSYGAERPVALGHTEEAYQLNRRSDIVYE